MKSQSSGNSKISKGRAEEEAEHITILLRENSEQPKSAANNLMAQFTPGQQGHILSALGRMLRRNRDTRPEYGAVEKFLKGVAEQLGVLSARRLAGLITTVAMGASLELGPRTAAEIIVDSMISNDRTKIESSIDNNLLKDLVVSLDSPSRLLALLVVVAGERALLSLRFLSIWTRALTALLVKYAVNGTPMRAEDADTILRSLISVRKEQIPDDLLISIPLVVLYASNTIAGEFSNSEAGKLAGHLASFERQQETARGLDTTETDAHSIADYSRGDTNSEHSRILRQLSSLFSRYESEIVARQQIIADEEVTLRDLTGRVHQREQELIALRQQAQEERTALRANIADLDAQVSELRKALAQAQEDERRWRTEAELKDREAATRIQIAEGALNERLRVRLSGPSRNLRDHVLSVLTENRGNKKVRLLAGAFDVLHRHVMEITKEDSGERIPAELYMHAGRDDD